MLTLKNVLTINALSSGATGLLLALFADSFASWFGIEMPSLFVGVGIFLIAFAAFVLYVSRKDANASLVKVVIALDVAWVIISALVIAIDNAIISGLGIFMIAAVALWVTAMAYLQQRGLKATLNVLALLIVTCISASSQSKSKIQIADVSKFKNKPVEVVSAFIDAINNDHKKIPSLLDSAMQWYQPGNNQLSGVRNNLKEVFQLFGGFNQLSGGTLALTNWKILGVNGNQVVCLMHWKAAQPTGRVLDVDNIDVYTVHSGKITNVVVYTADPEQEDRFWMK